MKNNLIISDTGPIISLALIDCLYILKNLFENIFIPKAVWNELTENESVPNLDKIKPFFQSRVKSISGVNKLNAVMDLGESEAVILFKEQQADILLVDDKKARDIAESLSIKCVGTIGLLAFAKEQGLVQELRPLFVKLLLNKRFYSISLLNAILIKYEEAPFKTPPQRTS